MKRSNLISISKISLEEHISGMGPATSYTAIECPVCSEYATNMGLRNPHYYHCDECGTMIQIDSDSAKITVPIYEEKIRKAIEIIHDN